MHFVHMNRGTCSRSISLDINQGIVSNVEFDGGCPGNTKAIGKLVEGMSADDIYRMLHGNTCGRKPTSCGDQLAEAVQHAKAKESEEGGV